AAVEKEHLYRDIAVEHTTNSLSIELATHRFFKDNGAEIDEKMLPILQQMAETLKQPSLAKYTVSVDSHTDDTPPQSGLYTSNTELSAIRAAKVADYLIAHGIAADHLKAVGYGQSRPKVPNKDAEGRPIEANRAKNQRVTIKVE